MHSEKQQSSFPASMSQSTNCKSFCILSDSNIHSPSFIFSFTTSIRVFLHELTWDENYKQKLILDAKHCWMFIQYDLQINTQLMFYSEVDCRSCFIFLLYLLLWFYYFSCFSWEIVTRNTLLMH